MIKKILIGFGILLVILIAAGSYFFFYATRQHSPRETTLFTKDGNRIEIIYSRPSVKDRLIFGPEEDKALQPFGKYWRLGANQATIIILDQNTWFNGEELEKGKYSMYAVPGRDVWEIGFNSESEKWGAMEPDYAKDVINISVPADGNNSNQEMFLISFDENDSGIIMTFLWEKYRVETPIGFNP